MLHKRAQAKLDSATLASVTKEMAEPRMSRSARGQSESCEKFGTTKRPIQIRPRRETS
jgi:hypothetical protein